MPPPRRDSGGGGGTSTETTPLRLNTTTTNNNNNNANGAGPTSTPKRKPSIRLAAAPPPPAPSKAPGGGGGGEAEAVQKMSKAVKLGIYVAASTFTAAANSVLFKQLTNSYRPHYTFFCNQMNVALYVALAALVVLQRRVKYGAHWWHKQDISLGVLSFMGFLDATGSVLSTVGGAYTAGAVQTLLNQVIIPMTLALSFICLGQRFTWAQTLGALVIFVGAAVAVVPSFMGGPSPDTDGDGTGASTATGVILFFSSIVPGAFSNVYKEWGFARFHVDLYYLTTCVSAIQVLFGFAFLPFLQTQAFGGIPLRQIPQQFVLGYRCFQGVNSLPGDDCADAAKTMIGYVLVNFLFNVLQLLITKHGGATLLVISAALALPVTNVAFKMRWIMGDDVEPFSLLDVVALLIVLAGFLLYATFDDLVMRRTHALEQGKRLPIQFAAGSVMYLRERSNSDPSTPGYTPIRVEPPRRRGSIDLQLQRSGSFAASVGGSSTPSRLLQPSKAIPILQQQQRKRGAGVGLPVPNSYQIRILESHDEEITTVSI